MNTCFAARSTPVLTQSGQRGKLGSSEPSTNGHGPAAHSLTAVALEPLGSAASLNGGRGTHKGPIRVLIADDHPVVRRGLTACLSQLKQVMIVGEAADGREALRKAKETPDTGKPLRDFDLD